MLKTCHVDLMVLINPSIDKPKHNKFFKFNLFRVITNVRRPLTWLLLTLLVVLLVVYHDVVKPESQNIRTHQQDRVTRSSEHFKAFARVHNVHVLPEEKAEKWIVVTTINPPTKSIKVSRKKLWRKIAYNGKNPSSFQIKRKFYLNYYNLT